MDRKVFKMDAKSAMREAIVSPYAVTVIYGVITLIMSAVQKFFDLWERVIDQAKGDVNPAHLLTFVISAFVFLIVVIIISTIIDFGYRSYCLKVANRDTTMSYGDLFSSARYLLRAIGLCFMTFIFVALWTLLLIVPGIIAAYRYKQAIFIMVEDPSKGVFQCIRESNEMMIGHKWEYFVLELSFILWELMAIFTCGLGYIYVYPYRTVTLANYYNALKPKAVVYEEFTVLE